jgi:hypothetical protein
MISARREREVIMRKKEDNFFQCTSIKIIHIINSTLRNDEAIAARHL